MAPLRVVLCGAGFMGVMHAQVYALLPKVEVVAVVDACGVEAAAAMQKVGVNAPVFTSLQEALKAVPADVVDICLPTDLHEAFVLEAAQAGKAIFCEKPLSLNTESGRRMVEAVRVAGGPFQVGHCIRFWPEYEVLRDLVQGKREPVGALKALNLQRRSGRLSYSVGNWLNDPRRSRGAALDLHIHDTDFVVSLLGTPAWVMSRGNGCDHVTTLYGYDSVAVVAEGGWGYPAKWGFQMAFQAVFENGALEFDSTRTPSLRLTVGEEEPRAIGTEADEAGKSKVAVGNVSSLGGIIGS